MQSRKSYRNPAHKLQWAQGVLMIIIMNVRKGAVNLRKTKKKRSRSWRRKRRSSAVGCFFSVWYQDNRLALLAGKFLSLPS